MTGMRPRAAAAQTGFLLQRAHRRLRMAHNDALRPLKLNIAHLAVTGLLAERGDLSQRQLIEILDADKSTMVYLVDELEAQGLVVRRPAPADRRAYAVHLTDEGRARLIEAGAIVVRIEDDFLAPLSPRERTHFNRLLRRITEPPLAGVRARLEPGNRGAPDDTLDSPRGSHRTPDGWPRHGRRGRREPERERRRAALTCEPSEIEHVVALSRGEIASRLQDVGMVRKTPRSSSKLIESQFLEGLESTALDAILSDGNERTYRASQILYRLGEPAARLFLLRKGRVKLTRATAPGRELVMAVLVAGDVCGLGTLLDVSEHYYATAESIEPTEVLIWSRSTMHRLAATHPQLSQNALRVALRYVAVFAERHIQLVSGTAEQRLARTLTRLGTQSGIPTATGVDVAITNELLAALSDVSPFTASRTLGSWSREGAVRKRRGHVYITSPEKLVID